MLTQMHKWTSGFRVQGQPWVVLPPPWEHPSAACLGRRQFSVGGGWQALGDERVKMMFWWLQWVNFFLIFLYPVANYNSKASQHTEQQHFLFWDWLGADFIPCWILFSIISVAIAVETKHANNRKLIIHATLWFIEEKKYYKYISMYVALQVEWHIKLMTLSHSYRSHMIQLAISNLIVLVIRHYLANYS